MVLKKFWSAELKTYPKLAQKAQVILLPISTTYL